MKTLTTIILATLLSGCAMTKEQFAENMRYAAVAQQQQAQANQRLLEAYMQNNPVKRTDFQCVNNCSAAGYQYALCQSKCSY